MNIYFEATSFSIGMVSENGEKFYGEFTDFEEKYISEFEEKYIIPALFLDHFKEKYPNTIETQKDETFAVGEFDYVTAAMYDWIVDVNPEKKPILMVGDVCPFYFIRFMAEFPEDVLPLPYDIRMDLCPRAELPNGKLSWYPDVEELPGVLELDIFNIYKTITHQEPEGKEFNSLAMAECYKGIYEAMRLKKPREEPSEEQETEGVEEDNVETETAS